MNKPYHEQLLKERTEMRKNSRDWLQCLLAQTPPTYEFCKTMLESKGMALSKTDYEDICQMMKKEPLYEKTPGEESPGVWTN